MPARMAEGLVRGFGSIVWLKLFTERYKERWLEYRSRESAQGRGLAEGA